MHHFRFLLHGHFVTVLEFQREKQWPTSKTRLMPSINRSVNSVKLSLKIVSYILPSLILPLSLSLSLSFFSLFYCKIFLALLGIFRNFFLRFLLEWGRGGRVMVEGGEARQVSCCIILARFGDMFSHFFTVVLDSIETILKLCQTFRCTGIYLCFFVFYFC